jgi:hypothetical protein
MAAAMLAGCGGSQPPIGAPGAMPQTFAIATHAERGTSWMLPEAKSDDLLYVGGNNDALAVYSYPKGKLVGVIENQDFGLLSGECVDKAGDVFVTSLATYKVFEYKHGGAKPIATITETGEGPIDCSVDLKTGDLAVTNGSDLGGSGNVQIYAHASGTPTTYTDPDIYYYYFCGYDDKGNLYIDGQSYEGSPPFQFAELPKGSSTFTSITLNQQIIWPSSVLWDGKYVAVGDQDTPDIYEFSISGSAGTLERTTPINSIRYDMAFWIQGRRILVTSGSESYQTADFFNYPAGGNPTKILTKDIGGPHGLTVSLANK